MWTKRDAEFARFCSIARGSASELEYHLLLAGDLKLIEPADYDNLAPPVTELNRLPTGLLQKLNADRRARTAGGEAALCPEPQGAGVTGIPDVPGQPSTMAWRSGGRIGFAR